MTAAESTTDRESASASPNDRATLHARLDALLDRRERIEARMYAACPSEPLRPLPTRPRELDPRAVYSDFLALAADASGPVLPWLAFTPFTSRGSFLELTDHAGRLRALRDRLLLARALLEPLGERPVVTCDGGVQWTLGAPPLDVADLAAELSGLANGDRSDVFAPDPSAPARKQGDRPKRMALARARFRAFELDELFRYENAALSEDKREPEAAWRARIAEAFGVSSWHTIRQWEEPCRETLDAGLVEFLLMSIRAFGILDGGGGLSAAERIRIDGDAHRAVAKRSKTVGQRGSP